MDAFTQLEGMTAPLDRANVDTDQIIPARFLKAVERMLPRNSHGRKLLTKLRVFSGAEHLHAAQNPEEIDV